MSLALHHVAMALPSDRAQLAGSGIGVYVGAGSWISGLRPQGRLRHQGERLRARRCRSPSSAAASYILGLTGPCLSLDTACSSYLVAAHLATSAMTLGECATAVATSVGFLQSDVTFAFSAAGMLSLNGRCHTFDGRADATAGARHGGLRPRHGHGAGRPIEVGAASGALAATSSTRAANMGHLEASASAAGLRSVLVTMIAASTVAPNAMLRRHNGHLGSYFKAGTCGAPTETIARPPRVAGASGATARRPGPRASAPSGSAARSPTAPSRGRCARRATASRTTASVYRGSSQMGREPVFFHLGLPRAPGRDQGDAHPRRGHVLARGVRGLREHVVMSFILFPGVGQQAIIIAALATHRSASADIVLEGIQLLRPCQMREGSEARFRFASNLDQTYELSSFQDIAGDFKTHTKGHEADAEAAENYRTYALNSAFKAKGRAFLPRNSRLAPAGAGRLGAAAQQKPMVPAGARAIVPSRRLLNKVITRDRSFHFTASWVGLCIPQKTATEQTLSASILKSLVDGDDPEISFRMHRLKLREISGDQAKGAGPGGSLPPIAEGQGDAAVPARAAPVYDVVLADKAVDRSRGRRDDDAASSRKARAARTSPGARGAPGARGRVPPADPGTLRVRAVASTAGARVRAHRPAERALGPRGLRARGRVRRRRRRRAVLAGGPGAVALAWCASPGEAAALAKTPRRSAPRSRRHPRKAKSPRGMTKTKSLLASSSHALDMLAGGLEEADVVEDAHAAERDAIAARLKANLEEKLGMPLSKHEAIIDAITRKIEATLGKFGARAMGGGMRKRFATRFAAS
ncbi:hypothetical protein JL721_11743 [Aureococcus anophagefferens]|nr:hypothetical protein JL721_11743 [Aureococcus anophagefferens]